MTRLQQDEGFDTDVAPDHPRHWREVFPITYRSPLLDSVPGAVEADPPDAGVAWHYGEWSVEQRRLVAGEGFVDLSHRGVVRVSGPDRLGWLNSITSQKLEGLAPHTPTATLVLSPNGACRARDVRL